MNVLLLSTVPCLECTQGDAQYMSGDDLEDRERMAREIVAWMAFDHQFDAHGRLQDGRSVGDLVAGLGQSSTGRLRSLLGNWRSMFPNTDPTAAGHVRAVLPWLD